MPYISKEDVKLIREIIKNEFPKFKFSVKWRNYSVVDISVLSGPIDFGKDPYVNHFYIKEHWGETNPEACEFLLRVNEIADMMNDGSGFEDADYGFVPSYYKSISIGEWNRPYVLK